MAIPEGFEIVEDEAEILTPTADVTEEGRPIFKNQFDDFVTERTITVTDPRINQGKATNIPTVFNGQFLSDEDAINSVVNAGGKDPITGRALLGFGSINEAVQSAQSRSASLLQPASNIPAGFEVVSDESVAPEDPEDLSFLEMVAGVGQIAFTGVATAGEQAVEGISGLGGLALGRGVDESLARARSLSAAIPDVELGEQGQRLVAAISKKFNASPQLVQDIVKSISTTGESLGESVFEATGSPAVATAARILPEALGAATGLAGVRPAVSAVGAAIPDVADVAQAGTDIVRGVPQLQTSTKRKIAQLIREGSTDVETAPFRLQKGPKVAPEQTTKLQKFLDIGGPRVKKDTAAISAIDQGFDEGVIAAVKGSSPADKAAFSRMVNIAEKTKKNKLFGMRNRPSDVTGDLLMGRLNVVRKANRDAGKQLDTVAKSLKRKPVDVSAAVGNFTSGLDDMGITLSRNVEGEVVPNFKGSDIEGLAGPEAVLKRVIKRMSSLVPPDAFEVHRLKRFIDEQVTFGKNAEGLAGEAEFTLKKLRRNLDKILDDKFPKYDEVNTQYAETIGVLDRFQDVAGRKMNLTGDNVDKATGTLMRRLMGNAQSRIRLLDSIDEIEGAAKKFGGKLTGQLKIAGKVDEKAKSDLLTQVLFADELDSVFGPAARTSLQGQFDQALERQLKQSVAAGASKGGLVDIGITAAGAALKKARGINEAGAFKAIKKLLNGAQK